MSDIPITITGPVAAPVTYTLSPLERWTPTGVSATFDGSGAAGDFLPCCSIYSQSGVLLGRMFPGTMKAGDVSEVTYSPFSRPPAVAASTGGDYIFVSEQTHAIGDFVFSGIPQDARHLVLFLEYQGSASPLLEFNGDAGPHYRSIVSTVENRNGALATVLNDFPLVTTAIVLASRGDDTNPGRARIDIPYYRSNHSTGFRDRTLACDYWCYQHNQPSVDDDTFRDTIMGSWTPNFPFLAPPITSIRITSGAGLGGRCSLYKIK